MPKVAMPPHKSLTYLDLDCVAVDTSDDHHSLRKLLFARIFISFASRLAIAVAGVPTLAQRPALN